MSTRLPRPLDAVEVRVLGSLLEKEQTNPESVPLTVNALLAACNQKTNRTPVTELSEDQVVTALDRLRAEVLVWRSEGGRSERWQQAVSRRWGLSTGAKALLTLLLLRGAQTAGELRTRSQRLHDFPSVEAVEEVLRALAGEDEPLVRELARRPGQKEGRWIHRVGEVAAAEPEEEHEAPALSREGRGEHPALAERVAALEAQVASLAQRLAFMAEQLGLPPEEK